MQVPERSVAKYLILRLADRPRQAAAISSLLGPINKYGTELSIISNVDEMPYVLLTGRTDLDLRRMIVFFINIDLI